MSTSDCAGEAKMVHIDINAKVKLPVRATLRKKGFKTTIEFVIRTPERLIYFQTIEYPEYRDKFIYEFVSYTEI